MTEFEDGLWARLVDEHDADGLALDPITRQGRRRPLLVGGGAATVAGATVAAVLAISASTGAPPAYAMTQNADGSITVTINDLATAAPELNAKFASMGVQETVVPVEASCPNVSHFLFAYPHATMTESITFIPGRKWLAPGFTGVIAAEQLPNGEVAMMIGAIKPPVPSCYSSQAVTTRQIGGANGVPTVTAVPVTPSTPASPGG
jgi:hypothetical protein